LDPDPGSKNVADPMNPDPKHCILCKKNLLSGSNDHDIIPGDYDRR